MTNYWTNNQSIPRRDRKSSPTSPSHWSQSPLRCSSRCSAVWLSSQWCAGWPPRCCGSPFSASSVCCRLRFSGANRSTVACWPTHHCDPSQAPICKRSSTTICNRKPRGWWFWSLCRCCWWFCCWCCWCCASGFRWRLRWSRRAASEWEGGRVEGCGAVVTSFFHSNRAVSSAYTTVFFPIFPWILQVAVIGFAIVVGLMLVSVGEQQFQVVGMSTESTCVCQGPAAAYAVGIFFTKISSV